MNIRICEAIKNRNILKFYYDNGVRIIEPYCYGIHKKTGNEVLRAYQISGFSKSGRVEGWKLFEVTKITGIENTKNDFQGDRIKYNSEDYDMSKVFCYL